MPISFPRMIAATCQQCRASFEAVVWYIVDAEERPDLWARCQDATIHEVPCPNGHIGFLDAPLLLHDGGHRRVFFVPTRSETQEQNEEIKGTLLQCLHYALPPSLHGAYLMGARVLFYEVLPLALHEQAPPQTASWFRKGGRPSVAAPSSQADSASQDNALRLFLEGLAQYQNPGEMPRRVQLCEQAIQLLQRADDPTSWAMLQFQLGNSLQLNPLGDRADNLERALRAYEAALMIWTRETHPELWAVAQCNMGNVWQDRIRGNRADNLERAIEAYEAVLAIQTAQVSAQRQALAQNNLGNAYWQRIRGDRADNLERAIAALHAALTVRTRKASPIDWAMTQNNLGNAFRDRIDGDRADNLERAIEAFNSALSVFTSETTPDQWAQAQNNLANAYVYRIGGDRAENLEAAIQSLQAALTVFHHDAFPEQWAMVKLNMATAYLFRIQGARAENLERAIEAYTEALYVYTPEAFPADWAMTQHNLGNAYRQRVFGDRGQNLERAIEAYEKALTVYKKDAFPRDWAMVQVNLGTAYRERGHTDGVEMAIQAYESALAVYTEHGLPEFSAGAQINLGVAYLHRTQGTRAENLQRAIDVFQDALTVYTREGFPEEWAKIQNNLGNAYEAQRGLYHGESLPKARQAFRAALEVYLPDKYPYEACETARNLAHVHVGEQNWGEAHSALLKALDAAERLYAVSLTAGSKAATITQIASLYQLMVDVCLRFDPPRPLEAFLYAEEGRARALRNQLGFLSLPRPPDAPADILEHEAQLLRDLRDLGNWIQDAPDATIRLRWTEEAINVRAELDKVWDTLDRDYGASAYVSLRRGGKSDWQDLQHWLTNQGRRVALLEFFTLADRLIAFIVRAGESDPRAISLEISPRRQWEFVRRFYREVRYRFDIRHPLAETWRNIGALLFPQIMPHLNDAELVIIIPHAFSHELPLHALEFKGKPLIEYFPIVYAPSAAIAMQTTRRYSDSSGRGKGRPGQTLVIGNPTGDLGLAEQAAREVAERFGVQPLLGNEATKAHVRSAIEDAVEAHFMTHAYYKPGNPLRSGICLAYGEVLTAQDGLTSSLNLRLLALWGCETGAQDIQPGDERMGLAPSFLCAGVSSIIMSMWEVSGAATVELMNRFYNCLYDVNGAKKAAVADALRTAILEAREQLWHTCYWAPIILYGEWQ